MREWFIHGNRFWKDKSKISTLTYLISLVGPKLDEEQHLLFNFFRPLERVQSLLRKSKRTQFRVLTF